MISALACILLNGNFLKINEGFTEEDLESNLQRDKYARLSNMVTQLIDELTPSAPDFQLREACDQLVSLQLEIYSALMNHSSDRDHD